mgnify:FL=1
MRALEIGCELANRSSGSGRHAKDCARGCRVRTRSRVNHRPSQGFFHVFKDRSEKSEPLGVEQPGCQIGRAHV